VGNLERMCLLSTLLDWAVLVMLSREHGGLKEGEAFSTLNPATHTLRYVSLGLEVGGVGLFWLYMGKWVHLLEKNHAHRKSTVKCLVASLARNLYQILELFFRPDKLVLTCNQPTSILSPGL
jgi:hypothetical protein